jgi:tRNA-dihydrouridine synthase
MQMRIDLLVKHITLYDYTWKDKGNFNVLKRFFKIYLNGFEGAAHWRDQLMHCKNCGEALEVIKRI